MDENTPLEPHFGNCITAIWCPGWHQLDQPIAVGDTGRWWFYQSTRRGTQEGECSPLQFFNRTISSGHFSEVRTGTILAIHHSQLGNLQSVDTRGLDYIFRALDGREYCVNAEENPGIIDEFEGKEIIDWSLEVVIRDLSDPLADLA